MSTRATYRFKRTERFEPDVTIYVHHDGYPSGAAAYLYETLTKPSKGNMATQFIRAVDGAEITTKAEDHGDLDYRWVIEGHGPTALLTGYQRVWGAMPEFVPVVVAVSLHEFIAQNTELIGEDFKPFREVELEYRKAWLNEITAGLMLNGQWGPVSHLTVWKQNGHDKGANWDSQVKAARNLVAAFPSLETDELRQLIA